eukprot:2163267-Amphidinium_carterae.1
MLLVGLVGGMSVLSNPDTNRVKPKLDRRGHGSSPTFTLNAMPQVDLRIQRSLLLQGSLTQR